ncbi:MAG: class I SAM-dependent methyltransferase, partial [Propionibacteriales bacterium]|nr:class I SAM-dependent methyltransferase [Propionibacteriales bacterium]
ADLLAEQPTDRALLRLFAELVAPGPVLDAGCGTGELSAHLAGLGLDVWGIDLSSEMVARARERHSELTFRVGSMLALGADGAGIDDGSLAGVLAHYSTIHLPTDQLPAVFAEFRRVLRPGGHAMINFQVRAEVLAYDTLQGHPVALHYPVRSYEEVLALLVEAGFVPYATTVRSPVASWESVDQAYLLVTRGSDRAGGRPGSAEGESL